MTMIKITDLDLTGKRVLIRSDLNVPVKNGVITSNRKIHASLPTIKLALKKSKHVMVTSHLGRPIEGEYNAQFSLQPVVEYLKKQLINRYVKEVRLVKDYLEGVNFMEGELLVLENVRFNKGEKKDDEILSKKYAMLCDVFIMDAFGSAHRTQASTHGIGKFVSSACSGLLLQKELEALGKALCNPMRPMVAIVGGSKVSTKLIVLDSLSKVADYLIVGGGIANTFLAAQGKKVGKSLYEEELIPTAKRLLENCDIPILTDVRVSTEFSETAPVTMKAIIDIKDDEQILDLGDESITRILDILNCAKTILWNGPIGVFEFPNFRKGTEMISHAIAKSNAFSIVGGGDTLMAIDLFDISDQISYISTGGGAFLEFIEGKTFPSVKMLEKHALNNIN
ncbi:phosphoglycerate kinase [Candidatus Blochmanniella camponoti]|uniref:Phosphoglycerate kinase n=1 Tax=Candidatus Blochmanniella camponoti TaxID=108080 RepID=A0AAE9L4T5_9ENTR|nr:phosphoglycerate kinase [Candidatus Blochmannia herculeanus]URJ24671.1 phosphoglycerate kinase [Candidatus Blochmannia herculeanus]URJ26721.1 phosphoglycerate kinase [Candidatus Blochmannia herculeanus]URJ27473.1 phosphoglycerate kinase [Candidatus Blochmannia herculeanus]